MHVELYEFEQHGDDRGQLVAVEALKDIPFEIKRVYYMYNTKPNVNRGFHAHKNIKQILICVHGSCEVILDTGVEKETILLNNPKVGLFISNSIWREMHNFSKGAVLMVLASEYYSEEDYIRNYDDFLRMPKGKEEN